VSKGNTALIVGKDNEKKTLRLHDRSQGRLCVKTKKKQMVQDYKYFNSWTIILCLEF